MGIQSEATGEFHQNFESFWRLLYSKTWMKGKLTVYTLVFTVYTGVPRHFPLNQLPLLGTNPPRCADDRILIGYTSGLWQYLEWVGRKTIHAIHAIHVAPFSSHPGEQTVWSQHNMGWCTQLLKNSPKPWIGIDGVAAWIGWFRWVIVHGIDLVQRIDIQLLGKQSPWNLMPWWMVGCFFWAQQTLIFSSMGTWDITSGLTPLNWHRNWHICANFSAWTWKNLAGYVAMNPCWAIYFTTKQWWDPVGFAVIFSSDGELIKN